MKDEEIAELQNLGGVSAELLSQIGITTKSDLEKTGPIPAFCTLWEETEKEPNLNLLYAMVGALKGVHWQEIAQTEKYDLLMELEAYKDEKGI